MIGQGVQPGSEAPTFPAAARQYLHQRRAFQLLRVQPDRFGKAFRHAADPAQGVCLPQPVRPAFLIFAQQQADHLGLFFQLDRRVMLACEGAGIDDAAGQQRQGVAGGKRAQRQLAAFVEHDEQPADTGQQERDSR